jgi:hypothetical protein
MAIKFKVIEKITENPEVRKSLITAAFRSTRKTRYVLPKM